MPSLKPAVLDTPGGRVFAQAPVDVVDVISDHFRLSAVRPRVRGIRSSAIHLLAITSFLLMSLSSCVADTAVPLAVVDLNRIAGGWYIVATIPNCLERGVIGGYDVFTPEPSGDIREDFYMQLHSFENERKHFTVRITVQPDIVNADWRVHILPVVSLPFQVLYVDPKYNFVLFGEQNREWGWIYSRKKEISDSEYQAMLAQFKRLGYDTSKFLKFIQSPEQIGQPGYWSDGIQGSR